MGILADIGRSTIGEQAIKLQNQALNIRQLQEKRRQQEFENTMSLNKFALEKQNQMQEQKLNELKLSEAQSKVNQIKDEEKRLNTPVDITDLVNDPVLGPSVKKHFEGKGWITGNISGRVQTKEKYMGYYLNSIVRDNKLSLEYNTLLYNAYTQKMQTYEKILREQEAGIDDEGNPVTIMKPEKIAQFKQIVKNMGEARQSFLNTINDLDEKVRQTREQEKIKGEYKKPDVPKFQAKTRTFVDTQTQKVITEEFDFDPSTGSRTVKNRYEYPVGTIIMGYDPDGNAILGTTKGPFQTSKATGEDIPLSRTKVEELKEEEAAISNSIHSIRQVQQLVGQSASVIGAVGAAQRFIDSLSSQLQSLASLGGFQSTVKGKLGPDSQLLNPELYDFKGFAPEATKSAQVKSMFTKLAYSIARAQEPGGRLSDRDIQGALTQLAGSTGSPAQMHAVLNLVAQNLEYEYANKYRIMTKQEFPGFGKSPAMTQQQSQPTPMPEAKARESLRTMGRNAEEIEEAIKIYKEKGRVK